MSVVSNLKEHFRRNWKFESKQSGDTDYIIANFKKDDNVRSIIVPEIKAIKYEIIDDNHVYEYISSNTAQEFLNGMRCFYPNPILETSAEFDKWLKKWMHDWWKRNKKVRELYGYEK